MQVPYLKYHAFVSVISFRDYFTIDELHKRLQSTGTNAQLALDPSGTNNRVILHKSASGHTTMRIETTRAVLRTMYSGEYTDVAGKEKRHSNARTKVNAAFEIINHAGLAVQLLNASYIARLSVSSRDENRLLQHAALKAFTKTDSISFVSTGDHSANSLVDLNVKRSDKIDDQFIATFQLSSYQDREMLVEMASGNNAFVFRDWEGRLVSEGLQLVCDVNNRGGLLSGKRDWNQDDLNKVIDILFDNSEVVFDRACLSINEQLKGSLQ